MEAYFSHSFSFLLSKGILFVGFFLLAKVVLKKRCLFQRVVKNTTLALGISLVVVYVLFTNVYDLQQMTLHILDEKTNEIKLEKKFVESAYIEGEEINLLIDGEIVRIEKLSYDYDQNGRIILIYVK